MNLEPCNSGSNNIHFNFPALMSDGRLYSDWQQGALSNENVKKQANIKSNWQYRKYLTDNADSIIKNNQLEACMACGCVTGCDHNKPVPNNPYIYNCCLSNDQPFGYETSDLKELYLSRNQLQCRLTNQLSFAFQK